MGQRVKERSLSADAVRIQVGASVDLSPAIEKEASRIEKSVLGGDMEKRRPTEGEHATARSSAIKFRITAVDTAGRPRAVRPVRRYGLGVGEGRRAHRTGFGAGGDEEFMQTIRRLGSRT